MRSIATQLLVTFSLTFQVCCLGSGGIDLSSPDAAIHTYCDAVARSDLSAIRQVLYTAQDIEEESFKEPIWTQCRIVSKHKTNLVGTNLGGGLTAKSGDVEIIVEVTMIDPQKGNPKTRFWYLVRNFEGDWKIVSHSHVPDEEYPQLSE